MLNSLKYEYFAPFLYNRLKGVLEIYSHSSREYKRVIDEWLTSLSFDELESLRTHARTQLDRK